MINKDEALEHMIYSLKHRMNAYVREGTDQKEWREKPIKIIYKI